jgi:hypothetical protein
MGSAQPGAPDPIVKLSREVVALQLEVTRLSNIVGKFAGKHELRTINVRRGAYYPEKDGDATLEPRSTIQRVLWELKDHPDLPDPAGRILKAIARDIDGALQDIRAARLDVLTIKSDPDLRDAYLDWKARRL